MEQVDYRGAMAPKETQYLFETAVLIDSVPEQGEEHIYHNDQVWHLPLLAGQQEDVKNMDIGWQERHLPRKRDDPGTETYENKGIQPKF